MFLNFLFKCWLSWGPLEKGFSLWEENLRYLIIILRAPAKKITVTTSTTELKQFPGKYEFN